MVRVVGAAREAGGDARGNPEVAEHQGHRAGEVLAVPALRAGDEPDERRHPGHLRRMLVVVKPPLDRSQASIATVAAYGFVAPLVTSSAAR